MNKWSKLSWNLMAEYTPFSWFYRVQNYTVISFLIPLGANVRGLCKFCWFVISWITGLLLYNARRTITLFDFRGDVNSWVRVTHEIHENWSPINNDYPTAYEFMHSATWGLRDFWVTIAVFSVHPTPKLSLDVCSSIANRSFRGDASQP